MGKTENKNQQLFVKQFNIKATIDISHLENNT